LGVRKRTILPGLRAQVTRLRGLVRRFRELPARVAALDRYLMGIDSEVQTLRNQAGAVQVQLDEARARADESARMYLELRDSVHLVARRTAMHRSPTRVLFLVHLLGVWDSCRALVEAMRDSDDFEPIVASIPRRFRGSDGLVGEDEVHRGLVERGVPHLRFAGDAAPDVLRLIKSIEPDVIFRQSQWDADIPDELGTQRLSFARTCLIPYETMNIVVNVPEERTRNTAVDSDYHRGAWLVFCTNQAMLEAAVADGARGGAQFRVVGHPKADHLRSVRPSWPIGAGTAGAGTAGGDEAGTAGADTVAAGARDRPGRIVWSAHHTVSHGWTDFGTFHLVRDEMLAWARERTDVEFVFMPHPALLPFPGSEHCLISRPDFDAWMHDWAALPNTAVLSEVDYGPALAASDVMVTDGLSMLVEYQLVGKPVIFIERVGHRPFNPIGERVALGVHPVPDAAEARALAERFLGGDPDPLRDRQRDNVAELFGPPGSVDRILSTLRHELARERGETAPGRPPCPPERSTTE
jgi:hypothetical protein